MKAAIILGSSKSDGNTRFLVDALMTQASATGIETTLVELTTLNISFYDYEHHNRDDDFLPLIHKLLEYDHLVFASPVYWYSMSAQLKVFFDRLSDLLTIEKELGRQLKGRSISVVSTGYQPELPSCFIEPFILTAQYMALTFKGFEYLAINEEDEPNTIQASAQSALKQIQQG